MQGLWVLGHKPIDTSTKGLNLMRKQEIDSLSGPFILNLKDRTLDLGNWYMKRNLRTYCLIWTWFLGCRWMQPSSWNTSNAKGFDSWTLSNAHDILSYFCDLHFLIFFFIPAYVEWNASLKFWFSLWLDTIVTCGRMVVSVVKLF